MIRPTSIDILEYVRKTIEELGLDMEMPIGEPSPEAADEDHQEATPKQLPDSEARSPAA